ncbi:MAG: SurA N-terminal domain-containing protein, partial [Gammaproteobacteria bacterium]|nr:SurA N-terminal domain-containing protein [Gammaproteobacteria bacterium]
MLQLIRDRAQGVLIWTIVGLIIITFALFGLSSYLSGSSTNYVASVNSVEIKEPEFRRETQRIEQKLGKEYRPEFSRFVKAQAIDRLVMRELLNQYQKDERFYVSDSSVLSELNKDESFKGTDGK